MRFGVLEKSTALPKQRHRLQQSQAGRGSAAYVSELCRVRFQIPHLEWFSIYSLELGRYDAPGHSKARLPPAQDPVISHRRESFIARIARRSRRAMNQSGGRISKSLGVNSSVTSAAKISAHGLPQTDFANALLSDCNSRSMCRASEVLRPQYLASANPVFFGCTASSFLHRSA